MKNKIAVITVSIGDKYRKIYSDYYEPSQKRFAEKIGADFIVVDKFIRQSSKHPTWQKLLAFEHKDICKYETIIYLDADIYVTKKSINPVNNVPENYWGAVTNNAQNIKRLSQTDINLYDIQCPKDHRPNFIINSGFLVLRQTIHKNIMEKVYNKYDNQSCGEQAPLSYHLINESEGKLLDWKFNAVIPDYLEKYSYKLSSIINLFEEGYFIHSAGGINKLVLNLVRIFDNHPMTFRCMKMISKISIVDYISKFILKSIHSIWIRYDLIKK